MENINPLPTWGIPSVLNKFNEISLETLNFCANKCVFCCVAKPSRKKAIMSMDDLRMILEKIPDFDGVVNMSNTGDPILLDDLPERVKMIRDAWPESIINCTSTLAIKRDKSYFEKLFHNGLSHLLLSCYAFSDEDYKKFHGSKNFNYVQQNISYLLDINKETSLADHFILRDLNNFNDVYPVADYEKKRKKFKDKLESGGLWQVYDKEGVLFMNGELKDEKDHWHIPVPCHILWGAKAGRLEIRENLDIVPCCVFPEKEYVFGNLKTQTINEIFYGAQAKAFRDALWNGEVNKIPVCNTCYYYDMRPSNQEEVDRIVAWEARQVQDKEVIFWGGGQAYRQYGSFFNTCKPIAMIIDSNDSPPSPEIDGIPVCGNSILEKQEYREMPLIIFAFPQSSKKIIKIACEKYGHPLKIIYVCPPNYEGVNFRMF